MPKLLRGRRYVQVALDFVSLEEALAFLRRLGDMPDNVIVEVGTPLIKAEGVRRAVSTVRRAVGERTLLLADMKTADTGALEAELALSCGADLVTVLGSSEEETLAEAVETARRMGGMVEADLIGVRDPLLRAKEVVRLGVDVVGLHIGIDTQRAKGVRVAGMLDLVRKLKDIVGEAAFLSAAGGVRPEETGALTAAGADIVVVGGAIAKAASPREALLEALKHLQS